MANGSTGRILGNALQMGGSGAALGTSIAPGLGTAIGGGAGLLIGGIMSAIGEAQASGDIEKAEALREQAIRLIEQIQAPQEVQFNAQQLGPSAWDGVKSDPLTSNKIQSLIAEIEGYGDGSDPLQTQAYSRAFRQADRQAYNQMQDALAQHRRRGTMGSGVELGALLNANEEGADAVADASMGAASDMYRRRFDALNRSLAAQQMERNQADELNARRADARDRISQFNATQNWNAQIAQAQQRQQAYQNQLTQTQMKSDAMMGRASNAATNAANTVGGYSQMIQGLAGAANAIAPYADKFSGNKTTQQPAQQQAGDVYGVWDPNRYKNVWR